MFFAALQLVGGVILALGWIPQIIQVIRTKSVVDLSLKAYLLILLGISLMEVYAISLFVSGVGLAFFITNTLSLCIVLVMVVLVIYYQLHK